MSEPCIKVEDIARLTEKVNGMQDRMEKYEKTQETLSQLSESVALMVQKMGYISNDIKTVKTDVGNVTLEIKQIKENQNVLESKQDKEDAEKWKAIWKRVLDVLIGGVVMFLLTKWGL